MQVWLIEVNVNPAMHTNCDTLSSIVPPVIEETLGEGTCTSTSAAFEFIL